MMSEQQYSQTQQTLHSQCLFVAAQAPLSVHITLTTLVEACKHPAPVTFFYLCIYANT